MKKLGKLTMNEMQDFVPLNPEEQMAMKGGIGPWTRLFPLAWEITKIVYDLVTRSGSTSQDSATPSGSNVTKIYGPDSVVTVDGTRIYYPDSVYLGSGN